MKTPVLVSSALGALLVFSTACSTADHPATQADAVATSVGAKFASLASSRATYNFNPGWKFAFGDAAGADQPAFDDSAWASVSLPHTWNETDTYRAYINHSGGDQSEKMLGIGWYRKHFKLPASAEGRMSCSWISRWWTARASAARPTRRARISRSTDRPSGAAA